MQAKSKLGSDKKAYLQIDFIIGAVTFFLLLVFVQNQFVAQLEVYDEVFEIKKLEADAKDLCLLFTKSPGYPTTWNTNYSSIEYLGFESSLNISNLNGSKFTSSAINNTLYKLMIDTMNLDSFIGLTINGLETGTKHASLGFQSTLGSLSVKHTCYSMYNGEPVLVSVEVWK